MICGSHVIGGGHVMGVDVMEVNGGHDVMEGNGGHMMRDHVMGWVT